MVVLFTNVLTVWVVNLTRVRHITKQTGRRHMTPVGFDPTRLTLVELETTRLDHSGNVS